MASLSYDTCSWRHYILSCLQKLSFSCMKITGKSKVGIRMTLYQDEACSQHLWTGSLCRAIERCPCWGTDHTKVQGESLVQIKQYRFAFVLNLGARWCDTDQCFLVFQKTLCWLGNYKYFVWINSNPNCFQDVFISLYVDCDLFRLSYTGQEHYFQLLSSCNVLYTIWTSEFSNFSFSKPPSVVASATSFHLVVCSFRFLW